MVPAQQGTKVYVSLRKFIGGQCNLQQRNLSNSYEGVGVTKKNVTFSRTISYATSVKQMSDLYIYLCSENPTLANIVDMFHSETSDEKKSNIIKKGSGW